MRLSDQLASYMTWKVSNKLYLIRPLASKGEIDSGLQAEGSDSKIPDQTAMGGGMHSIQLCLAWIILPGFTKVSMTCCKKRRTLQM